METYGETQGLFVDWRHHVHQIPLSSAIPGSMNLNLKLSYQSLFLDLAFLLIATLVLLVQDPFKKLVDDHSMNNQYVEQPDTAKNVVRSEEISGTTFLLKVGDNGAFILIEDGRDMGISQDVLISKLESSNALPNVILVQYSDEIDYKFYREIRASLKEIKNRNLLERIYEVEDINSMIESG